MRIKKYNILFKNCTWESRGDLSKMHKDVTRTKMHTTQNASEATFIYCILLFIFVIKIKKKGEIFNNLIQTSSIRLFFFNKGYNDNNLNI